MKMLITALFTISAQTALADVVTIDFESLAHTNPNQVYSTHAEEGYKIDANGGAFNVLGSSPSGANYVNSATFASNGIQGESFSTILERTDGQAFSLISIDLARFITFNGTNPFNVTFTGLSAGSGSSISETVTYVGGSSGSALQTFLFNNLNNVTEVSWQQGISASAFQFDNIVVTSNAVSAVPEPTSLWLFATGIPCLIAFRRKFNV
jgi:hypothetical protein